MQEFDVIIVGAGPAGLWAAQKLAEAKLKVLCLDKKQEIGVPKRCAEGLGLGWFERVGLKPNPKWAVQEIDGSVLYSPEEKCVELRFPKTSGYVLERRIFEKELARLAAEKGALIKTKSDAFSLNRKNGKVEVEVNSGGEIETYSAPLIMACDGVESLTARRLGLNTAQKLADYDSGYQYEMTNIDFGDERLIHLYFGKDVAQVIF